jgi:transglutaminase-like putative cysteine protease
LTGTTILPEETKAKMRALIGDEKNPIMKAKLIYDYVQQKSRYVSIQVGIGGWKPMDASDVDRLGYGDCKGLTNYTKALWRQ